MFTSCKQLIYFIMFVVNTNSYRNIEESIDFSILYTVYINLPENRKKKVQLEI